MTERNPWADRWEFEIGRGFQGPGSEGRIEQEGMKAEADYARAQPTFPCPTEGCTLTSFYRPAVTGFWCEARHLTRAGQVPEAQVTA